MSLTVGVDVGGTFAKAVLADAKGRVRCERQIPTQPEAGPETFLDRLAETVRGMDGGKPSGLGLAVAGLVDARRGLLRASPNLPGWKDVPLGRLLSRRLKVPVVLANDANAAAWGLYRLEAEGRDLVAVTLGTGVGGGLVLDGRLHEGAFGSAGEIGHAAVAPGGEPCGCGNRGCLEAYAGGRHLVRRFLEVQRGRPPGPAVRRLAADLDRLTPRLLADLARAGDPIARSVWADAGRMLGRAAAWLACVLNPSEILLTGGVSRSAALLLPALRAELASCGFQGPLKGLKVRASRHPNPGAQGAALLAAESRT